MANKRKIRQSQTIFPFGVGGIIDLRGESFVATDITTWGRHGQPIASRRLATKLGVRQFRAAPRVPDGKRRFVSNPPGPIYSRFPKWLFCPQCRSMIRWRSQDENPDLAPTCGRCVRRLVPMRFIQICERGHMADVDWVKWAHSGAEGPAQDQCGGFPLKFFVNQRTSGLASLLVTCMTCKASRTLSGITNQRNLERLGMGCTGRQPWQRPEDAEECDEGPVVVQKGASNVYFPDVHSAIDIPNPVDVAPEDSEAAQRVHDHVMWPALADAPTGPAASAIRILISVDCMVTEEFVEELVQRHSDEVAGGILLSSEVTDLSEDEWKVFNAAEPRATPSSRKDDLVTREVGLGIGDDDADYLRLVAERVTRVVAVDRLREVRALQGYWRLNIGTEHYVSVHPKGNPSWLPAVESYGEGVFLALDEQRLQAWEKEATVHNRVVGELEPDLENALRCEQLRQLTGPRLLPRYPMLHTLAHMLIRQLAFDCGYSAASLRERVYARGFFKEDERRPQAGVLVYTAAGDVEGTLGGLVRQGEPPNLAEAIIRLLESGMWCSNDPLCAQPSGFANLNRAACHACTFLPETSCETGNALLDRTLVIGSDTIPGFFRPVIDAATEQSAREVIAQ